MATALLFSFSRTINQTATVSLSCPGRAKGERGSAESKHRIQRYNHHGGTKEEEEEKEGNEADWREEEKKGGKVEREKEMHCAELNEGGAEEWKRNGAVMGRMEEEEEGGGRRRKEKEERRKGGPGRRVLLVVPAVHPSLLQTASLVSLRVSRLRDSTYDPTRRSCITLWPGAGHCFSLVAAKELKEAPEDRDLPSSVGINSVKLTGQKGCS
ncbi:unnamed protein product [Pleuronectes platessa]|uniref:Uncharacterized protein n=1 Tax=Pleuronectes platessa TaxID=8262 RepID=A0A9N7VIL3_PLEPL|nr:unnamed protein product [Pleuronectes platessa]